MAFLDEFSETVLKKLGKSMYLQKLQQYFPHEDDEEILLFVGYAALKHIDLSPYVTTTDTEGFSLPQLRVIADGLTKRLDVSVYAKEVFSGEQMSEILSGLETGVDVTKYAKPMFSAEQMEIIRKTLLKGIDIFPSYIKEYAVVRLPNNTKTISDDKLKSLSYCLEHDIPRDDIDYWLIEQNLPFEKIVHVVDAYNIGIDLYNILACAEDKKARSLNNWSSIGLETIKVLLQSGVDVSAHVSDSSMNLLDIIFDLYKLRSSEGVLQIIQKGARQGLDLTKIPYSYYRTLDIIRIIKGMMDGYTLEEIIF